VDHLENCSHLTYPAVCPLNETSTVDVQQWQQVLCRSINRSSRLFKQYSACKWLPNRNLNHDVTKSSGVSQSAEWTQPAYYSLH
jgi:hypothetical protein